MSREPVQDRSRALARDSQVRAFVRKNFGVLGTLKLHRFALGADLLRAPLNVALAPVFLLTRLAALLARLCRVPNVARWLMARRVLLPTRVGQHVEGRVQQLIAGLAAEGLQNPAPEKMTRQAIADYTSIRNATAEITTTCLVLLCGYLIFRAATPGVISMAGPVAEMQAHQRAVENFWAGQRLGAAYYGVFATKLSIWQVVFTGVVLAMIASVVTTFAGVIADPLQVITGLHRRRLHKLLDRLDQTTDDPTGVAPEHIAARGADIADILLNIWRGFRG